MSDQATARQIANALRRPEVQAIIDRWKGVKFRVDDLAFTGDLYVANGEFVFADGSSTSESDASAPTVVELSLALPSSGNMFAARAALEQEIGKDLRSLRGQIQRARYKRPLKEAALRRWCWDQVRANLVQLLKLDPCDAVIVDVTDLVRTLVVKDVMES